MNHEPNCSNVIKWYILTENFWKFIQNNRVYWFRRPKSQIRKVLFPFMVFELSKRVLLATLKIIISEKVTKKKIQKSHQMSPEKQILSDNQVRRNKADGFIKTWIARHRHHVVGWGVIGLVTKRLSLFTIFVNEFLSSIFCQHFCHQNHKCTTGETYFEPTFVSTRTSYKNEPVFLKTKSASANHISKTQSTETKFEKFWKF